MLLWVIPEQVFYSPVILTEFGYFEKILEFSKQGSHMTFSSSAFFFKKDIKTNAEPDILSSHVSYPISQLLKMAMTSTLQMTMFPCAYDQKDTGSEMKRNCRNMASAVICCQMLIRICVDKLIWGVQISQGWYSPCVTTTGYTCC